MANKLIEELIIKVKQQGAKPTTKAIKSVADSLGFATEQSLAYSAALDELPKQLFRVAQFAEKTAGKLGKVRFTLGTDKLEKSVASIEHSMGSLVEGITEMEHSLAVLNNNLVTGFSNSTVSLGSDLERIEDRLIDVSTASERASKSITKVGKSSEKAGRGMGNAHRQGRNIKRTFSDIANIGGPLTILYAQIAANAFALSEAFRLLSEGEQLNRLEEVGIILGSQIGIPVQTIAQEMQKLTGYTLSYGDSIRQASAAASYGFSPEQIEQLTLAARRASIALGVDMQDALNRVIRGTSKLEIELLDELGITTKLTTAYENYAKNLGISAQALNSYQQRAALVAEINNQSVEKFGSLDAILQNGAPWETFGANVATAFQEMFKNISEATSMFAEFFNSFIFEKDPWEKIYTNTENIRDAAERAFATGARGGLIGLAQQANTELLTMEKRLADLRSMPAESNFLGIGENSSDRNKEIAQLVVSIERLKEIEAKYGLDSVNNLDVAADAYRNLNMVVKGSVPSYELAIAKVKGQAAEYEKLYSDVRAVKQAFNELRAADPAFDSAEALRQLKFSSEGALNAAVATAKTYRDASRDVELFNLVAKQGANRDRMSGKSPIETDLINLRTQLGIYSRLLDAQERLKVTEVQRSKTQLKMATIESQILDKTINLVNHKADQEATQIRLNRAGEPELQIKKSILENEQQRLNMMKNVEGSYLAQQEILQNIQSIQNEIRAEELSKSMSIYDTALSALVSYTPGLDQLTSSLNAVALSFDTMGQSSLTATQMTSMGLQAFQGVLQHTSAMAVDSINAQINAEKNRDGKSKESLERIKQLEQKKIREQKKAAQQQILISTAVAVMNAAANPWPMPAIPLMATAALAGGLAYAQASSANSNALSGMEGSINKPTQLTVGKRDNRVDVSGAASQGELSYVRGEAGQGSVNSFTPRAAGGIGTPGTSILVGENGPETITPIEPVQVSDNEELTSSKAKVGKSLIDNLNINAIDAQSFIDRAPEIYEAFAYEAAQRGQDVNNF